MISFLQQFSASAVNKGVTCKGSCAYVLVKRFEDSFVRESVSRLTDRFNMTLTMLTGP